MVVGQAAVGAAAGEVDASVASAVAHRTQPHGVGHVGRKAADNGRRGGEGVPHCEVVARNADVERCPVALPVESERGAVDAHRHPVDQARLHAQVVEEKPRLARAAAHQHETHMLVQVAEYRAVVLPLFCLREKYGVYGDKRCHVGDVVHLAYYQHGSRGIHGDVGPESQRKRRDLSGERLRSVLTMGYSPKSDLRRQLEGRALRASKFSQ